MKEKSVDCAMQHIKVFREQHLRDAVADFGEPCKTCMHKSECRFDWFNVLLPLSNQSKVKINLADQGQIQQQGKNLCGNADSMDIHRHTDKNTS